MVIGIVFYSYIRMKYFTVLVFGLLAITFATDTSDNCEYKVDLNLIPEAFCTALSSVSELPVLEYGDNYTIEFLESFALASRSTVESVNENLYLQAEEAANDLVNNITQARDDFWTAVDTLIPTAEPVHKKYCLEDYLRPIIDLSNNFLSLIPGNALIKRPGLPELPTLQIQPQDVIRKRTLNELFVEIDHVFDQDLANLYSLITSSFLRGWNAARFFFLTSQKQFRDEFLNDLALRAHADVANEIFNQSYWIKYHVREETWTDFENIGNRIVFIYRDYVSSRNNETCTD